MSTFAQATIIIFLAIITLCVWKILFVVAATGRVILKTVRFLMEVTELEIKNETD